VDGTERQGALQRGPPAIHLGRLLALLRAGATGRAQPARRSALHVPHGFGCPITWVPHAGHRKRWYYYASWASRRAAREPKGAPRGAAGSGRPARTKEGSGLPVGSRGRSDRCGDLQTLHDRRNLLASRAVFDRSVIEMRPRREQAVASGPLSHMNAKYSLTPHFRVTPGVRDDDTAC
jgi:hypothetical protein